MTSSFLAHRSVDWYTSMHFFWRGRRSTWTDFQQSNHFEALKGREDWMSISLIVVIKRICPQSFRCWNDQYTVQARHQRVRHGLFRDTDRFNKNVRANRGAWKGWKSAQQLKNISILFPVPPQLITPPDSISRGNVLSCSPTAHGAGLLASAWTPRISPTWSWTEKI